MHEDAINAHAAALRDILQRRAPDIDWYTIHDERDQEAVLWVRVRAVRGQRLVQFVLIVPAAERADSLTIAARIIHEALRLLSTEERTPTRAH